MPDGDSRKAQPRPSLIERRVEQITRRRSATLGLASTFVVLALIGGIVIRFTDPHNFSSVGLGIWWALQTVTTVGYGDVVPTSNAGRVVGGIEMVIGVAFIAFVTAGVTSTLIQRNEAETDTTDRTRNEQHAQTMISALSRTEQAFTELNQRLDRIEDKLR